MPKYYFDTLKTRKRNHHMRKYTDNFLLKEDGSESSANNSKSKSHREVPKTRCAIQLIN